jgi:hypothetical protein
VPTGLYARLVLGVGAQRVAPLPEKSLSLAQEALDIADRCEYRLVQTNAHLVLAELALAEGNRQKAQEHAETARERAWCDGPPPPLRGRPSRRQSDCWRRLNR